MALPDTFCQLSKLTELYLGHCSSLTTLPDTDGYGLLCSGWITNGDNPNTYHEVALISVANSIARITTLSDAQYPDIYGTFPQVVIKQVSGVGATLNWSCQRIS